MRRHLFSLIAGFWCLSYTANAHVASTGPAVGSTAPDFKAHNVVTRQTIPLSSQRGRVVILTFWASWCAPCRRELPILEKAQRLVGKDKLTVFAVSYRETPQAAASLSKLASTWQINVLDDPDGWIAGHYAITAIPHLFIIGRNGNVLANHVGYGDRSIDDLVTDINQALSEATPADPEVTPSTTGST